MKPLTDPLTSYINNALMYFERVLHHETIPSYCHAYAVRLFLGIIERDGDQHIRRRGTVLCAVCACCLYHALKKYHLSHSPMEICALFQLTKRQFTKGCKIVLAHVPSPLEEHPVRTLYIRYGNMLRVPYRALIVNIEKVQRHQLLDFGKYTPATIAGALLAFLSYDQNIPIPIDQICAVTNISAIIILSLKSNLVADNLFVELTQASPTSESV